jgi:hypothetical protein
MNGMMACKVVDGRPVVAVVTFPPTAPRLCLHSFWTCLSVVENEENAEEASRSNLEQAVYEKKMDLEDDDMVLQQQLDTREKGIVAEAELPTERELWEGEAKVTVGDDIPDISGSRP